MVLLIDIFSVLNIVLNFLLMNIEKYLKPVAGFTLNSFSLRLARNTIFLSKTNTVRLDDRSLH